MNTHKIKLVMAAGLVLALVILGSQATIAAPADSGSSGEKYFDRYTVEVFIPSCCPRSHFYAGIDDQAPIRITVMDRKGNPVSGLTMVNFIIMSCDAVLALDLTEAVPGSYEGVFDIAPLGVNYSGHAIQVLVIRSPKGKNPKLFVYGVGSMALKVVGAGDINADRVVDMEDFYIMAAAWNSVYGCFEFVPEADLNHDHIIDMTDRFILDYFWGASY